VTSTQVGGVSAHEFVPPLKPVGLVSPASGEPAYKSIYTINDLAKLHGFSRRTVIRLYEREPGVQLLERPEVLFGKRSRDAKPGKRRYRTFRVPHAVYQRVKARMEVRRVVQ